MAQIWAVRGATTIATDTRDEVTKATTELLREIFTQNQIIEDDLVSIMFTVTTDIQSEFPAVAARDMGITNTPLMCAQEITKKEGLPLCIRVLIHFYTTKEKKELQAVYLREAVKLRPDLTT